MTWCAISDIHGQYDQLIALEQLVQRHEQDVKFIYNGDYVDRGPQSLEVLRHIKMRVEEGHVAIMGNHDIFLLEFLIGEFPEYAYSFGDRTIQQLAAGLPLTTQYEIQMARAHVLRHHAWIEPFLKSLPFIHEEGLTVFIHGGFNPYRSHYAASSDTELTMPSFPMPVHAGMYSDKSFVFGHVHTRKYHQDEQNCSPFVKQNFAFIDGASVSGGQLNGYMSNGTYYSVK